MSSGAKGRWAPEPMLAGGGGGGRGGDTFAAAGARNARRTMRGSSKPLEGICRGAWGGVTQWWNQARCVCWLLSCNPRPTPDASPLESRDRFQNQAWRSARDEGVRRRGGGERGGKQGQASDPPLYKSVECFTPPQTTFPIPTTPRQQVWCRHGALPAPPTPATPWGQSERGNQSTKHNW